MQSLTITTAWLLCERSLGDAEYLADMRTLILPLVKVNLVQSLTITTAWLLCERSLGDAEYLADMRTLILAHSHSSSSQGKI